MVQSLTPHPTASGAITSPNASKPTFELNLYTSTIPVPSLGWTKKVWYNSPGTGVADRGDDPIMVDSAPEFDYGFGSYPGRPINEGLHIEWEGYMTIPSSGELGYVADRIHRTFMIAASPSGSLYVNPADEKTPIVSMDTPGIGPATSIVTASGAFDAGDWIAVRAEYSSSGGENEYKHLIIGYKDTEEDLTAG